MHVLWQIDFDVRLNFHAQILSKGKYKAVKHQGVPHKEKTGISWPVFNEKNPPKYEPKKYKDYVFCKLNELNKKWLLF